MANVLFRRLGTEGDASFTQVTNATAETTMASYVIPARTVSKRCGVRFRVMAETPSTNSTDTFALKLKLGSTALGTVAAFDAADADCAGILFEGVFDVSAGKLHGQAFNGRTGQAATLAFTADLTADFFSDLTVSVTGQWSVASADNVADLKVFNIEIFPEDAA